MSIIRQPHRRNYTVLPNAALRDERLSFRATGLLTYLLSLPDGAPIDSVALSQRKSEGRNAIRAAYRELIDAGYVVRSKEQKDDGKWVTYTDVYDTPPTPGKPTPGNLPSVAGKPTPGKPTSVDGALIDQVTDANNKGGSGFSDAPWIKDDKGYDWIDLDDGTQAQ
jgi:hypothetical protein